MKTKHSLLACILFIAANTFAQHCYTLTWAENLPENVTIVSFKRDNIGNTFLTGTFNGTADFGSISLTSSPSGNCFIAKRSSSGLYVWAHLFGNSQSSSQALELDSQNNIYVVASAYGSFSFLGNTFNSGQTIGHYLVKLNSDGDLVFCNTISTNWSSGQNSQSYTAHELYVTSSDDLIVSGQITLISNGSLSSIQSSVYKFNITGSLIWSANFGGGFGSLCFPNSIKSDLNGNIYVHGGYKGNINFGVISMNGGFQQGSMGSYVVKINPNGDFLWAQSLTPTSLPFVQNTNQRIAIDAGGNLYCSSGKNDEGASHDGKRACIIKMNTAGDILWTKIGSANSFSNIHDIRITDDDFIVVVGTAYSETPFAVQPTSASGTYISKLTLDGDVLFSKTINNNIYGSPRIVVDNYSNIFIGDIYEQQVNFESISLSGANSFLSVFSPQQTESVSALSSSTYIECGQSSFITSQLSAPVPGATYIWKNEQGETISTQAGTSVSPKVTTIYTVYVMMPNGCFLTDNITIHVMNTNPQPLTISALTPYVCEGGTNLTLPYEYFYPTWSTGSYNYQISVNQPGTYSVTAIIGSQISTEYSGCLAQGFITLVPFVDITSNGTTICDGQSLTLPATVVGNPSSAAYFWNTGANTQNITVNTPGTYSCQVVTADCSYTATAVVTAQGSSYQPQAFTHAATGLTVEFNNIDPNANTVSWNFGDGNTSTQQNPTHTFNASGTYNVCFNATNFCGQSGQICNSITVQNIVGLDEVEFIEPILVYPNPANQSFTIANAAIGSKILVYDITGKIVFEETNSSDKTTINSYNFVNGVYFINVEQNGIRSTHKIVISN